MNEKILLLIILATTFLSFYLERTVSWLIHLSSVCLIILSGMMLSSISIIPNESLLYNLFLDPIALLSLVLLTLSLKLDFLKKIPFKIIFLFFIGSFGSVLGGLIAGFIGSFYIGVDAFKIAAQLTASYIGGMENAVAIQKIYNLPNYLFISVFQVDNIVTSLWMMFCIWYASKSQLKRNEENEEEDKTKEFEGQFVYLIDIIFSIGLSLSIIVFSELVSSYLGGMHKILWMSILAIAFGQISYIKEKLRPSYLIGSFLFSGFFFSIGAIIDIETFSKVPYVLIIMPFIVVIIHAVIIIFFSKKLNLPKELTALVSQSLIGGPGTAVALAQSKKWNLGISIGIGLGVLGYAIANFFGVLVFNFLNFFYGA